jgi:hypothetical protein
MAKNEENARQRSLDSKDPSGCTAKKMSMAKSYQGARQSTKGIAVHTFSLCFKKTHDKEVFT